MSSATAVQGFPYPFQKEAATPVSAQNLATEVDTELGNADAQRLLVLRRPNARVTRATGSQSVPINIATVLTYDTAEWDTGSWYSAGTPNRLTLTPVGLYAIHASFYALFALNTDTFYDLILRVNGTEVARQSKEQYVDTCCNDSRAVSLSILYRVPAGQFIDIQCLYTGTAGTAQNITRATLAARFVAPA